MSDRAGVIACVCILAVAAFIGVGGSILASILEAAL